MEDSLKESKEFIAFKEAIKKEVIEELQNRKEKQTNWAKIKKEYEEEFNKFNWKNENKKIVWQLENAIGTLIRISYKQDNLAKMDVDYEDMKDITERILNIISEKRGK